MKTHIAPSSNFKNPLGLFGRMLLSGKRAAYAAIVHEAMRITARPLDALLRNYEQRLIRNASSKDKPVLLLVGAPRSGTTLVYQTLSRYLDVSFFTNLTSFFPRSPITGTRLFAWLPQRQSADFENFYGQTARLHGPNDGFTIWNQWLGDDRYVPRTDLAPDEMKAMRSFFDAWTASAGKPILNKNNRNTSCLDLLSRVLPTASFIVVRRNPLLVAQSLIRAREQVQGDKSVGWGLMASDQLDTSDSLSYVDDVCDQIIQIEWKLNEQLQQISPNRIMEFTYEGFCENPHAALREIAKANPGVAVKESLVAAELKPFEVSECVTLTPAEQNRLLARLAVSRNSRQNLSLAEIHSCRGGNQFG